MCVELHNLLLQVTQDVYFENESVEDLQSVIIGIELFIECCRRNDDGNIQSLDLKYSELKIDEESDKFWPT